MTFLMVGLHSRDKAEAIEIVYCHCEADEVSRNLVPSGARELGGITLPLARNFDSELWLVAMISEGW